MVSGLATSWLPENTQGLVTRPLFVINGRNLCFETVTFVINPCHMLISCLVSCNNCFEIVFGLVNATIMLQTYDVGGSIQ